MKKTRIHRVWILFLLGIMACLQVRAQYMPVVFDKKYGDKNQIQLVCPLAGDEVAMVGKEGQKYNLTWIGREGEVLFSLPLAGYISERFVDVGALVGPGVNSKLAAVVKSDTVLVDFKMTALDYLRAERRNIKFGEQDTSRSWQPTVTVTLADDSEYPVKGIVDFADPIVDPQTGTFGVRAELSNPNQKLLPGQFTKVKLLLDVRERAIVVPRKAISIEKGGAFIYVVRRDNVAEKRFVQTGPEIGNNIVIERGLGENEQVVIEGYHKLVPGMLVQPIQAGDDKAIEALRAEEEEE